MPRAKSSVVSRKRHKKVLKLAKGYYGAKSKLWIARINAAARNNGINYSKMMNGLKKAGVQVNRKMLADLAVNDTKAFNDLVDVAKGQLN
ncbi:MAG: 50S ribosomal protein L20 [Firmicutes bacterium]|nr:50S ribosomal protein L20 [Bacillota bacterium]